MPSHKRQHYLPSSYLKYFSDDQSNCGRLSLIWRFDGTHMRRVTVETQCREDYFYSKSNPSETEQIFEYREKAYCHFVDQLRLGQEPSRRDFGDFFLCMFDLNLRNAVYKNRTSSEGMDAYDARLSLFLSQMLVGGNPAECTRQKIKEYIQAFWLMEIISAPDGFDFITSDHPSVFVHCTGPNPTVRRALQLMILPIDPKHTAIAFDNRFIWLSQSVATPQDVRTINGGQVQNCENCVFISRPLTNEECNSCSTIFTGKRPNNCEINENGWRLVTTYLPSEHHFSFMKVKPPRF